MRPITREDLLSLGEAMTVVFESRETVLFQIQETLRAESTDAGPRVEREIATYAPLLPRDGDGADRREDRVARIRTSSRLPG